MASSGATTLSLGVLGAEREDLAAALDGHDLDVNPIQDSLDADAVAAHDVFVLAGGDSVSQGAYQSIRERSSSVPIVVVADLDALDPGLHSVLADDPTVALIDRPATAWPTALIASKSRSLTGGSGRTSRTRPLYVRRRREFLLLWLGAVLTYGVGDFGSTLLVLANDATASEANPIVELALELGGIWGFGLVKVVVFVLMLGMSVHGARNEQLYEYYGPPLALIGIGAVLTAWNLALAA